MELNHRLNQHDRQEIIMKFLTHTFNPDREILREKEKELALLVRNAVLNRNVSLGGKVFKEVDLVDMLPEGYAAESTSIWVNAGGYSVELEFGGSRAYGEDYGSYNARKIQMNFPISIRHTRYNITDSKLIPQIQAYAQQSEQLTEKYKKLHTKIHQFLVGIKTVKKLLETMPEIEEILGEKWFERPAPINALVVTAAEILCEVANIRGEKREGCCNGEVITL